MEKETWIQNVLESSDGMQTATANPYTATRVNAYLNSENTQVKKWQLSLSIVCVLLIFFSVLQTYQNNSAASFAKSDSKMNYSVNYSELYPY